MLIITGHIQQGKTSFLSAILDRLKEEELSLAGFLCPGSFESGERSAFTLQDVNGGDSMEVAGRKEVKGWFSRGPFWFNPGAFEWGTRLVLNGLGRGARILILDEVGPLELEGRGWAPLLDKIIDETGVLLVVVVRKSILREVREKWRITDAKVVEALPANEEYCIKMIMEYV